MKNKKNNEELQSRRQFFKQAAKGALPIIAATVLASAPAIVKAAEISRNDCDFGCLYGCSGTCMSTCSGSCKGACENSCRYGCYNTCRGDCEGSCKGSCDGRCSGNCGYSTYITTIVPKLNNYEPAF
ncbi:MAG: Cys-Xaa-Xaa-Xaa repeat radical SAM target protein [Sodaliphilus sp.]|nr:Cys-Xaa-Xaa-Xaa repeat radical SAM target protein [Sodaliphilus sp.]